MTGKNYFTTSEWPKIEYSGVNLLIKKVSKSRCWILTKLIGDSMKLLVYRTRKLCNNHYIQSKQFLSVLLKSWFYAQVTDLIDKGERLAQPRKCPDDIYETMSQCWQYSAVNRPTFSELVEKFRCPEYMNIKELINTWEWKNIF